MIGCKACPAPATVQGRRLCQPCHLSQRRERERESNTAKRRAKYLADPQRYLDQNRNWRYGITSERYDQMLAEQDQRCAICRTDDPGKKRWSVDHDHTCCEGAKSCGRCVRGLLCHKCNFAIGQLQDNPAVVLSAYQYLTRER